MTQENQNSLFLLVKSKYNDNDSSSNNSNNISNNNNKDIIFSSGYKVILENVGTLKFICDCYKDQKLCEKAVDIYAHALEFVSDSYKTQKTSEIQFVPDWYKTLKICDKAADTCSFVFYSVPDQYKNQEMCFKVIFKEPFMLKFCFDEYWTQECVIKLLMLFC